MTMLLEPMMTAYSRARRVNGAKRQDSTQAQGLPAIAATDRLAAHRSKVKAAAIPPRNRWHLTRWGLLHCRFLDGGHAMWSVLFIATMVALSALGILAACEE